MPQAKAPINNQFPAPKPPAPVAVWPGQPAPAQPAAPPPPATALHDTSAIVQPFLTPEQSRAWMTEDQSYQPTLDDYQRQIQDATTTTGQREFDNQHATAVAINNANAAFAARGLFTSSIRDADLNDLQATLTMKNNILDTALKTTTADITRRGEDLTRRHTIDAAYYAALAATNAQGVTPALGGPAPATAPANSPGATATRTVGWGTNAWSQARAPINNPAPAAAPAQTVRWGAGLWPQARAPVNNTHAATARTITRTAWGGHRIA
jgi:hypothetical protein